MEIFLDTNLFLRYLVNDQHQMADQVEKLFLRAEKGEVGLVTGPPVFFELAWTLRSFYKKSKTYIYECLLSIMGIPGLKMLDAEILEEALKIYKDSATDFSDAYLAASAKIVKADCIATFNKKHFKNLDIRLYDL